MPSASLRTAATLSCRLAVALVVLAAPSSATSAHAQTPANPTTTPFDIIDNSFIVEEAFNQEPGIFQNIFGFHLDSDGDWDFGFTQEWPLFSQRHQFSYTLPVAHLRGGNGFGDVMLNYRYQALTEAAGRPAFSPRLSTIIPSGDEDGGRGEGVVGWQVNLPFSKQRGDLYFHWGGGFTWLPDAHLPGGSDPGTYNSFTPNVAASAIWRTGRMFNLMLESLTVFKESVDTTGVTGRTTAFTFSPGLRTGWNLSDNQQLIIGFAAPVTVEDGGADAAAFFYFSYELPFRRQ